MHNVKKSHQWQKNLQHAVCLSQISIYALRENTVLHPRFSETLQIILHWLNAIIIFSQDIFFFWGTIFTQIIKKQEYIALILIILDHKDLNADTDISQNKNQAQKLPELAFELALLTMEPCLAKELTKNSI